LRISNGTEAAPGFCFESDRDTGIYRASTNKMAFSTAGNQGLVIDASGNVGIGATNPGYQLELSTDSAGKPSTSTWTITSDATVKENIVNVSSTDSLTLINNLQLKEYNLCLEFREQAKLEDRKYLGFLAQDVETYLPCCVTEKTVSKTVDGVVEESQLKQLNLHDINLHLVNAVKELTQRLELLE
jgi:hypothetical protein